MSKNGLNIVLCDDDEDDREFFCLVTQQWAPLAVVRAVESAGELIQTLHNSPNIDLVFLDLNMPLISGIECLRMIRTEKKFDEVPVIIYSTAANDVDVEATFRGGANLYVQKPVSMAELRKALERIGAMEKTDLLNQLPRKYLLEI
jgi:CheY-like chemotaxis protein